MTWTPLTRGQLDAMLADGLARFDDDVRSRWAEIKIEPARWRCPSFGDSNDEFWVVAVRRGQALWYNDIEDGFNWSAFTTSGAIDQYWCNQSDFTEILRSFALENAELVWRSGVLGADAPAALKGPGEVASRQPMYWELSPAGASTYRVHFEEEAESLLDGRAYSRMDLLDAHPVLEHYAQEWAMLDIYSAPADPARVASRLAAAVDEHTRGWRQLSRYSNGSAERLLAGRYGLLMRAPRACVDLALEILRQENVKCSAIADQPARPGYRALILDRSYVVARRFGFEERSEEQPSSMSRDG